MSIVVPTFQHARFLRQSLDSLLEQGYPSLEIIVVDGGSTDETVDILKSYGDRISWVSERDEGQSDALAKGFARAGGHWYAWLNADDLQINRALWRVNDISLRHPDAQVVFGRGNYIDEQGAYLRPYPTIASGPAIDISRELHEKGYVAQPSVFFRSDLYHAVGGVNRALRFAMDYDLWVRFARHGARFAFVDEELSSNRWHGSAKTVTSLLALLAEVVAVQVREYGSVAPYYVQAISDHLYATLHSPHRGDAAHLLYRTLYFKATWFLVNSHNPPLGVWGLLAKLPARSGPLVGDYLTLRRGLSLFVRSLVRKLAVRRRSLD